MIEVRISSREQCEYSTKEAVDAYLLGKMIAAGFPIDPKSEVFKLLRNGVLQHVGLDPKSDCVIWRWYEEGEFTPETEQ